MLRCIYLRIFVHNCRKCSNTCGPKLSPARPTVLAHVQQKPTFGLACFLCVPSCFFLLYCCWLPHDEILFNCSTRELFLYQLQLSATVARFSVLLPLFSSRNYSSTSYCTKIYLFGGRRQQERDVTYSVLVLVVVCTLCKRVLLNCPPAPEDGDSHGHILIKTISERSGELVRYDDYCTHLPFPLGVLFSSPANAHTYALGTQAAPPFPVLSMSMKSCSKVHVTSCVSDDDDNHQDAVMYCSRARLPSFHGCFSTR